MGAVMPDLRANEMNKEAILAWLAEHTPVLYAAGLSAVIAVLRVTYAGGTMRQKVLEASMCGTITLAAVSGLSVFGLPTSAGAFVGGLLGFIGVEQARVLALRFLGKKADDGAPR